MGTVVNAIGVILGGLIGLLIRRGLPEKVEQTAMKLLGLSVLIIGLNGVITAMITVGSDGKLSSSGSLLLIASIVIGGVLGECWDLDGKLVRGGKWIEQKFGKEGFAKGFINASLVFCVGAMAIVGSLADGLSGDSSILFIKTMLDFICSVILGSTLGFGVIFSFIPVVLYQGAITLFAGVLSPLISDSLLGSICMVGYTIVLCIGINFLEFTTIRTANLLPALLVPVIYEIMKPLLHAIAAGFSAF
ncbi:DUF554 domain-containing protein [Marasmitruncus massiliensis]|uniref:DUF554 domain-containing protein n=1 Tax=Marasmitruncus massiliensis TaxID=1944642 RepID=UPI000C7CBCAF|nr:DUF554 domain-containing protein [Marasmitruncus massiliensis]MBE6905048.1 DUF554 domain-containing protein [Oscillospiraceae bacterium]